MREITLPQLIQLIERYEIMPKSATVAEKPVVAKKTVAAKKPVEPLIKKDTTGAKTITKKTKQITKPINVEPVPTKKVKKGVQEGYNPQKDSMRQFIFEALKQGTASLTKIKQRAAKLAAKAGVKQYSTEDAYGAFDIAFFVKMLESKGFAVERDGEKVGIKG